MKCTNCANLFYPGQKFCAFCGQKKPLKKCIICGSDGYIEDIHCSNCGAAFVKNKELPTKVTETESIRKHATVLFAEIKDFVAPIEKIIFPVEDDDILSVILKTITSAVYQYDGTIINTIDNRVIAIFGAPQAIEDHALRACLSALAMQSQVKNIDKNLQLSIALNSGEILLEIKKDAKRSKYNVLGSTVSLAIGIGQKVKPNQIQITKNTLALLEPNVSTNMLGETEIEGFSKAIETFEVNGITETTSLHKEKDTLITLPFADREKEMKVLNQLLQSAKSGRGSSVGISGEVGQGKSRLVKEFIDSNSTQEFNLFIVAGFSHTNHISLFPIINLFQNLFHIRKNDSTEKIKEKVNIFISNLNFPHALNAILSLLEVNVEDPLWNKLEPQLKRKYKFDIGTKILVQHSLKRLLIIVVEDLHWVDSETIAFLDLLIANMQRSKILLVLTYRTEFYDHWINRFNYTHLELSHLSYEDGKNILDSILGENPSLSDLKIKLLNRYAGNPFFLEEIITSLINEKVLIGNFKNFAPDTTKLVNAISLPESIYSILQTQIDKLSPPQKTLMQVASVIGVQFTYNDLTQLMSIDEKELRTTLNELLALHYFYENRIYPELEISFKNACLHEVAYNSLLKKQRRSLHLKMLSILESLPDQQQMTMIQEIANHAYLGEAWEKAFYFCLKAAERAFSLNALSLSVHLYTRALTAAEHLVQTTQVTQRLVYIHLEMYHLFIRLSRFESQEIHLSEAMEIAIIKKNKFFESIINSSYSLHYLAYKDAKQALDFAKRGYTQAQTTQSFDAIIMAQQALVHAYIYLGEYENADEIGNALLEKIPDLNYFPYFFRVPIGYLTLYYLAWGQFHTGKFLAIENKKELLLSSTDISHPSMSSAFTLGIIGLQHLFKGQFEEAAKYLLLALKYNTELEIILYEPLYTGALAVTHLHLNQTRKGLKYLNRATKAITAFKFNYLNVFAPGFICEALIIASKYKRAKSLVNESLAICEERNLEGQKAWMLRLAAEIDLNLPKPNYKIIREKIDIAFELTRRLGMTTHIGHCHLLLAKLHQKVGNARESLKELNKALEIYKQLDMPFWIMHTQEFIKQVSKINTLS